MPRRQSSVPADSSVQVAVKWVVVGGVGDDDGVAGGGGGGEMTMLSCVYWPKTSSA